MFAEDLNTQLLAALDRPDLRVVADRQRIVFDPLLDTAFRADPGGEVVLGGTCLGPERICAFHIRHAIELSMLLDAITRPPPDAVAAEGDDASGAVAAAELPILAGLFAARIAARFWLLDEAPADAPVAEPASWVGPMSGPRMPAAGVLSTVWGRVRDLQGPAFRLRRAARSGQDDRRVPGAVIRRLEACWELLGPAETLMAQGGDARLRVDPQTGLNHYGCSHRPRPWAITFASSTASSLSERGFGGAEAARRRLAEQALHGGIGRALLAENERVRSGIAAHYALSEAAGIVLAASGTDSELIALAVAGLGEGGASRPISNILLAPEETGAGVPLAAGGRHFADDTARGRTVVKAAPIEGFASGTRVLQVAIRDPAGRLLAAAEVDAACAALAEAEAAQGRTVLLHRLDLSKTGLLAPSMQCLQRLQERLGDRLELVVDGCQARLDRRRVQDWLARGWMVMVTGSKFFTGPPFCGALLLPPRLAARLRGPGTLPRGLADYGGRADWPDGTAIVADPADGDGLRAVNPGLVLRWHAALAEMAAFARVPDRITYDRAASFLAGVEAAIAASDAVDAVAVPPPPRDDLSGPCWDQLQTIRSFLVIETGADGVRRPLDVARARRVYRWLNADVTRALPPGAGDDDRALARLLCHIGQPAPVADDRLGGVMAGALRISVGARLLSGEPSHEGLGGPARMAREIGDVQRIIAKIELLLRHWTAVERLDPEPRFASDLPPRRRADPGRDI